MLEAISKRLATYLSAERHVHGTSPPTNQHLLAQVLRPGDVLLVEGTSLISAAIKYLTQSTWSHAALYIGDHHVLPAAARGPHAFVEADLNFGVRVVNIEEFTHFHCRICRPIGLSPRDLDTLLTYAIKRIGHQYDTRNVVDLVRYLMPTPPVPQRWRRKMIAFGSGDPTRAICSTLIAQAFQSICYPILPNVTGVSASTTDCPDCVDEIMQVRHHSLFVPRDFDVSPYFEVVKPSLAGGFDYRSITWAPAAP